MVPVLKLQTGVTVMVPVLKLQTGVTVMVPVLKLQTGVTAMVPVRKLVSYRLVLLSWSATDWCYCHGTSAETCQPVVQLIKLPGAKLYIMLSLVAVLYSSAEVHIRCHVGRP